MITEDAAAARQPALQTRELFQAIVDNVPVLLKVYDGSGNPVFLNREFTRVLGWTLEEARKVDLMAECYPEPSERREAWKFLAGAEGGWRDFKVRARDGRLMTTSWAAVHLPDGSLIAVGIDASERGRVEAEVAAYRAHHERTIEQRLSRVRESEARFRGLLENLSDWIWEVDANGVYTYASPGIRRLLGYEPEEVVGKTPFDLMPPAEAQRVRAIFESAIRDRAPLAGVENVNLHKDGRAVVLESSGVPYFDVDGRLAGYRGVDRDVSERKAAERALQESRQAERERLGSQKYETVGRIAGGIAHHLNNLMTVVAGYGTLMVDRMDVRDPWRRQVEEMRCAGERAAALTAQLLAYSRRQILRPARVDLGPFLAENEPDIRREAGPGVAVSVAADPEAGAVFVDPEVLRNAILRVVQNSREAMPGGGTLRVLACRTDLSGEGRPPIPEGRYATIAVADSGVGMDAETRSQVFEPFFTTKDPGKGAGLSLASVYGFVKQSRGYIFAESAPGQGTTVAIHLPRVDADGAPRESV